MNNLNSNLGNKSNLNLSNNNNNSNSNSTDYFSGLSNMSLIILIAFGFIVIVFVIIVSGIYLKSYNQSKIRDHIEEELLPYIHDCKNNPKIIYGTKIPASTLGNEFSLSFWVYINGLDYRTEYDKYILFKGKQGSEKHVNPSIYIKQRTNTMVFALETTGSLSSDSKIGCYDKLDILTYNTDSTLSANRNTFNIKIDMFNNYSKYQLNDKNGTTPAAKSVKTGYNKFIKSILEYFNKDYFLTSVNLLRQGSNSGGGADFYIKKHTEPNYYTETNLTTGPFTKGAHNIPDTALTDTTIKNNKVVKITIKRSGESKYKIYDKDNKEICIAIEIKSNALAGDNTTTYGSVLNNINTNDTAQFSFKFVDTNTNKKKISVTQLDKCFDNNQINPTAPDDITKLYQDNNMYYSIIPLEFTIEETTRPKLLDDVKTGYYSISEPVPRSVNGCKSDLQKLMDNPDNSTKYKDDKYNFYGMTGSYSGSGDTASQNMCYSSYEAIPDNIFSKIKKDKDESKNKEGIDYKKLDDKYCVYDNKNYGLGSPNTMFIHSMKKDTGLEEVEIKNMPLQRWVNVTLQVHNNIIDIFMDGLLHKTHIIEQGAVKPNDDNIIIGSTGGFDGYVSRIIWANKALHPGEIYEKYKEGPRISLSITDKLKNLVGMGPKEPETRNDDQTNNNKY